MRNLGSIPKINKVVWKEESENAPLKRIYFSPLTVGYHSEANHPVMPGTKGPIV